MNLSFVELLKILIQGKNTLIFFLLTVFGLSFSMAVVLCNLGLMDGYEILLKEGLRKNSSDLEITSEYGFFDVDHRFRESLNLKEITGFTGVIRTEGFVMANQKSKGVLINGVDSEEFAAVSRLNFKIEANQGVVIGSELAKELKVKVGDWIVLTFTRGNQNIEDLPYMSRVPIDAIVNHGIYKKDLRIIYMKREDLSRFANTKNRVNTTLVNLGTASEKKVLELKKKLEDSLGFGFYVKPFWSRYKTLLDAVKIEKFSITIILQLIILIGLFNIVAFINFNSIKKSQDFFLLRALGVSLITVQRFWVGIIVLMWFISCLFALGMTYFIDKIVLKLPFLKLPGSIYELNYLELSLEPLSVGGVFLLTFLWSMGVIIFILKRESRKEIIPGLRQRFS